MTKEIAKQEADAPQRQATPIQALAKFLDGRKDEILKVLPDQLSVERVIKTAIMAAMENKDIGERCTPSSIYRSVMQASLMGLTVGSGFAEGYFIRYGDSCTFRASYLGWVKVATRSAEIDILRASVVYSNDILNISEQPPSVLHRPNYVDRGKIIGSLACAYSLVDGEHRLFDFTFVSANELDEARKMADKGRPSGAWRAWGDEMRKKVAIRRLCKMLPRNEQLNSLTKIENNADDGVVDVPDPVALPDTDNIETIIVDARFEESTEDTSQSEATPESVESAHKVASKKTKSSKLKDAMQEDLGGEIKDVEF